MRSVTLLLAVFSFQLFAEDIKGDELITGHDGKELKIFSPRKMTEFEKRRVHLRRDILFRMCQISFWTGKATGTERCLTSIAREDFARENDPAHSPDLAKIVAEIRAIRGVDELQDAGNPHLKDALDKLSAYGQAEVSVLESINLEELEARGETEYAELLLNNSEIKLLSDIQKASKKNPDDPQSGEFADLIPKEAKTQLAQDAAKIEKLNARNKELLKAIAARNPKPEAKPEKEESPEDAARRIIGGY